MMDAIVAARLLEQIGENVLFLQMVNAIYEQVEERV